MSYFWIGFDSFFNFITYYQRLFPVFVELNYYFSDMLI